MSTHSTSDAAYFADRCGVGVEIKRDTFVPCGLKVGHEGPHEPVKLGEQTASEAPAASLDPRCRCQRHHVCASCLGLLRENVRGGGRIATLRDKIHRFVKVRIRRRDSLSVRDRIASPQ